MCQLCDHVNAPGGRGVRLVMTTQRAVRVLAVLTVVGLVGCSGGNGGPERVQEPEETTTEVDRAPTSTTTTSTTTTTVPTTVAPTVPATTTAPPASPAGTTGCDETAGWTTAAEDDPTMALPDLYLVRVGRHRCFDRIVFDVNGVVAGPDVVGFNVSYVDGDVTADASGEPVPTRGDASLQVVVRAPALGYGTEGHQPGNFLARMGNDLVPLGDLASSKVLRQIVFAGSFEGQTTIAVGLTARRAFRVGAYERDGYSHVYVDIAHR